MKEGDYRNLLIKLGHAGIARLLGLRHTTGSVIGAVPPPPRQALVDAAAVPVSAKPGARMNGAARGLAKHCGRLPPGWEVSYWGTEKAAMTGGDDVRKERAGRIVNNILDNCVWINIHPAPGGAQVLELRVREGYGARWNMGEAGARADSITVGHCSDVSRISRAAFKRKSGPEKVGQLIVGYTVKVLEWAAKERVVANARNVKTRLP